MSKFNLIPFEQGYLEKYQTFARKYYGAEGYQAKTNYIDWLYLENPFPSNYKDFIIAVYETDRVVGCIHKMRLAWNHGGNSVAVPAIHNLMVDEEYRKGIGIWLVQASFAGEEHVFMPSTLSKPLIKLSNLMKYQRMDVKWYRKILRPVSGALAYTAGRYLNYSVKAVNFELASAGEHGPSEYRVTLTPSDGVLEQMASLMNPRDKNTSSPVWDREKLRWRFFHPKGPRHLLIHEYFTGTMKSFAIVSLGTRHGLNMGRILAVKSTSAEAMKRLMAQVFRVTRRARGHLLQLVSGDEEINAQLAEIGWAPLPFHSYTYIYHKDRKCVFEHCSFGGSAWDLGFEAIP